MNGWNVASSPSSTPMPRAPTWQRTSRPARDGALGAREDLPPLVGRVIALHRRDRQRAPAARARHLLEQVELGVEALGAAHHVEVAHRLEHAVPEPAKRGGDARELARVDLGRGRRRAARGAMVVAAPGREAGGAGLERRAQQRAHRGDVVVGRDLVGDRALAHHVHAQRVVRDLQRGSRSRAASRRSRPCTRRTTPSPTGCPRRAPSPGCPRRPPSARRARPRDPGAPARSRRRSSPSRTSSRRGASSARAPRPTTTWPS